MWPHPPGDKHLAPMGAFARMEGPRCMFVRGRTPGVSPRHAACLPIVPAGCASPRCDGRAVLAQRVPVPAVCECECVQITSPSPPTLHGCCCSGFAFSFPAPGLRAAALGRAQR